MALGSFQGAPSQTCIWQSLMEVGQLNAEEESWDIVTKFKEGGLVKEAKARAMNRLARIDAEMVDLALSANPPGDNDNDIVGRNDEKGITKSTKHGVASLLDGHSEMGLEEIDQNVTGSQKVHQESP
jgi:hypothetical protein